MPREKDNKSHGSQCLSIAAGGKELFLDLVKTDLKLVLDREFVLVYYVGITLIH